jgi:hypothetical protein
VAAWADELLDLRDDVPASRAAHAPEAAGQGGDHPDAEQPTPASGLSASLLARTTSIAPGSQAPLWTALPRTTAS